MQSPRAVCPSSVRPAPATPLCRLRCSSGALPRRGLCFPVLLAGGRPLRAFRGPPLLTAGSESPAEVRSKCLRRSLPLGPLFQVGGLKLDFIFNSPPRLPCCLRLEALGCWGKRDPHYRRMERTCLVALRSLLELIRSRLQRGPLGGAGVEPQAGAGTASFRGLQPSSHPPLLVRPWCLRSAEHRIGHLQARSL